MLLPLGNLLQDVIQGPMSLDPLRLLARPQLHPNHRTKNHKFERRFDTANKLDEDILGMFIDGVMRACSC